jgi:hypothetical protein
MGLQCTVLGHVYDTTEIEEREQDRRDGTVLICREYQVCSRCGDREELYRNEQVLATRDPADDSGTGVDEDQESDAVEETETERAVDSGTEFSDEPEDRTDPADDGARTTDGDDDAEILESRDLTTADDRDGDAESSSETGSDPSSVNATPTTEGDEKTPDEDAGPEGGVILSSSPETDTPAGLGSSETATADGGQQVDEAVETASPETSFEIESPDDDGIGCEACGHQWTRTETSLRDGDLCPECREGYVTVR